MQNSENYRITWTGTSRIKVRWFGHVEHKDVADQSMKTPLYSTMCLQQIEISSDA